jgi:hypothetical protein
MILMGDKDKITKFLKARKVPSAEIDNGFVKEEVEELDELSKKTLGSYVKKASRNLAGREYKRGAEKDASMSNLQKSYKRDMGITKAVDKLTKEEVELDEVSTATLQRYKSAASKAMDRASDSAIDKMLGSKDSQSVDISKEKKTMDKRSKGVSLASNKLAKEEFEQIDELSKKTLGSYVKKAAGSMAGKTAVAAAQASSSMGKTSPDIKRGIVNRMKGITRATDKLTKEEAEIEEKKLTPKQIKAALGAVKAKPKDQVSVAKAPWDMKKEDTQRWRVYNKILEADAHLKGATPPEAIDSKASQGEKDFVKLHGGLDGNDSGIDGAKAAADTAKNAAAGVKVAPKRPSDNPAGDKSVIKSTEAK